MEAYQAEAGGYMGVAAVVEPSLCVPSGEEMVGNEHSPLLEQQEEEEVKVRWTYYKNYLINDSFLTLYLSKQEPTYVNYLAKLIKE